MSAARSVPNRVPAPRPSHTARLVPDEVRARATQISTNPTMSGAAMSQAWTGATSAPALGPTRVRKAEIPAANTPAAIQSDRVMTRWLMSAPKNREASNDVAMMGSTTTSVPMPSATASNT